MNPSTERSNDRRRAGARVAIACVAIGIAAAFPSSVFAAPPPNDHFADAQELGGGSTASVTGTNVDATAEDGEPKHDGTPATSSVWYRWKAPRNGEVAIDTCGSDFDTVLAVYTGSVLSALKPVASNDDSCGLRSETRFDATGGKTYRIAVDGFFGEQGSLELELAQATPPPNDDFADAQDLGGESTAAASGTNVNATAEQGEPDHFGIPAVASVWYRWTAPANGEVGIDTCGSDFDTVLAVYTGTAVNTLTQVAANDDFCDLGSEVTFHGTAGGTYAIAVDGFSGAQGSIELDLRPSNAFTLGKAQRNRAKGTARLTVNVPGAGELELAASRGVRGAQARAESVGTVRLPIKPGPKARTRLARNGITFVKVRVTYTPDGGSPSTQAKRLKLIKRR